MLNLSKNIEIVDFEVEDFKRINKFLDNNNYEKLTKEELEFIEDDEYWGRRIYRYTIKKENGRNKYFTFTVSYNNLKFETNTVCIYNAKTADNDHKIICYEKID